MNALTARQYIALRYYYVEGWSYRRIGDAIGSNPGTVFRLVVDGRRKILAVTGNASPLVEDLCKPSPTANTTRSAGTASSRQEKLLDALDRRMAELASEEAEARECMFGDHPLPTHAKRNPFDHWESQYLNDKPGRRGIPTSAYRADRAARYCSLRAAMCEFGCSGCEAGSGA